MQSSGPNWRVVLSLLVIAAHTGGWGRMSRAAAESAPVFRIGAPEIARAREAIAHRAWAKATWQQVKQGADAWAAHPDQAIRALIPPKGAVFAFGAAGSPDGSTGSVGATTLHVTWDASGTLPANPGTVQDAQGRSYPNERYPDPGPGYRDPSGKIYYLKGRYHSEIVDRLCYSALPDLAMAWALTGDRRYAHTGALVLDALAAIYPTTTGHADYPGSHPESGRLGQDYYYVGESLAGMCLAYSLLSGSGELDQPSVEPGMTRRDNIIRNMLENGARYCHHESEGHGYVGPDLSNGMANYHRGTLAVGVTLGRPDYVKWVLEGPFGLQSMFDNTLDRDGLYCETAVNYVNHALDIWIELAEDLRHLQPPQRNLFADRRFQKAMWFPNRKVTLSGHTPPFGDTPPSIERVIPTDSPFDMRDWRLLEHALASVPEADIPRFEAALRTVTGGQVNQARAAASPVESRWMLFFARPLEDGPPPTPVDVPGVHSAFFDSKGISILRAGRGSSARSVLMFYGPTLNHGHPDELALNLADHGYEWSYDLGKWGLGSKHTMSAWATRTAAHNVVVVDERDQAGPASGGTLEAFDDFGPVRVMRASSPCYAGIGVTRYRRTVAMVDTSPETSYYLDVFDVEGGRLHDLFWHSQGEVAAASVELAPPVPGSLASPAIDYGHHIGQDGDIVGEAREGWAGEPPNGYGFIVDNQHGQASRPFTVEWHTSASEKSGPSFRTLHIPVQGTLEVSIGHAPGLYPAHPPAGVVRVRRIATGSTSCFVALHEAYDASPQIQAASATLNRGVLTVHVQLRSGHTDTFSMTRHGEPAPHADPSRERIWITRDDGQRTTRYLVRGPASRATGAVQTYTQQGAVAAVDHDNCTVTVRGLKRTPPAGSLITIGSERCHKRSVYRVTGARREGRDTLVTVDAGSLIAGRGTVGSDPPDASTIPNITPLPWARRLRGPSYTGLLTGKMLRRIGSETATTVRGVDGRTAQGIAVALSEGFRTGDRFVILDMQRGDTVSVESVR